MDQKVVDWRKGSSYWSLPLSPSRFIKAW